MIKGIEMVNVKGQTARQPLTGKDIIIGRNGSGKTTRMQSIGLAMMGYVPGKGKTVADTFKLASDDKMAVRMETDTFSLERAFAKTKKLKNDGSLDVKISQKLSVSPSMGETTNAQKEARIKNELGDLPVMLDFGSFISMTENQQRDFIYSLSGSGFSWNREKVESEMEVLLLQGGLEETNKELYDCMEECVKDTMRQYIDGIDVQAGILAMTEYAKDKLKYWKKEKITADGAAKKLTELKNRGEETDRDLTINQEKMKELQAKREKLIKEIAELSAKNKVLDEKAKEREKLLAEIEALSQTPDADRMKELESTIAAIEKELSNKEDLDKSYEIAKAEIQNQMASLQEIMKTDGEKLLAAKEERLVINAEIKANGDLLQRISSSHGCCAFSPNIPCNQDFSEFINKTQDVMDEAYDRKDNVERSVNELNSHVAELHEKIREVQEKQRTLDNEKKTSDKTIAEKKKQMDKLKSELSELKMREPMLEAKRKQEAEITAYLEENPGIELDSMEDTKTLLTGQIESLAAKIDEQKKVRNDLVNIKANIIDSQTAEFNVLCWTQICNAIGQKGIKGSILKEMLNPLLEEVDTKLHEIGINENFFFGTESDTGKEIFEFGWSSKPFAALSTGEQLLLMTALMTTIIERANPPVKVLAIDNVNDLDQYNLSRVMHGLNAIGKNMDNIILAGVVEPTEEDCEGWTVWRL